MSTTSKSQVFGYLPNDNPTLGAMLSLGFQQFLTMFPATVLVAILTKFDVGITLLASGLGTIVALLVSKRKIPMYYGSSFSYIAVVITVMSRFAPDCYNSTAVYCPEGVKIVQVGIILTAVFEILVGSVKPHSTVSCLPSSLAQWRWSSVWHWPEPHSEMQVTGRHLKSLPKRGQSPSSH